MTLFLLATIGLPLLILWLTALLNAISFPRLKARAIAAAGDSRFVSVLIPARNEAAIIGQTVNALLAQTRPPDEIIVLDDQSTDETAAIVAEIGRKHPTVKLISGTALPDGWLGKNWACQQLAQHAAGDWLAFTDADVNWQPDALNACLHTATRLDADLLTIWPTQQTVTWAERLTVPLIGLVIRAYLPLLAVHHLPLPAFAAANGQCLLFRRAAYDAIGGHTSVRDNIVEDVGLAQAIKRAQRNLRMADGGTLVNCRMYADWPSVRDGFAKNIIAGHANSVGLFAFSWLFHWLLFVGPWLWLLVNLLTAQSISAPLALTAASVGLRLFTAWQTDQRLADALLMPFSVVLMSVIGWRALRWRQAGAIEWKGRLL